MTSQLSLIETAPLPIALPAEKLAVIDFVSKNPKKNVMVVAVAGSGKTFLAIETTKILTGSVVYCAFAKKVSEEMTGKIAKIKSQLRCALKVGTVHSLGTRAVCRVFPKTFVPKTTADGQKKINWLLENTVNVKTGEQGVPLNLRGFVRKAYQVARQWGVGINPKFRFSDTKAWYDLVDHFDLENELVKDEDEIVMNLDEKVRAACQWTAYAIKLGASLPVVAVMIDFEDMIYLPLFLNIKMDTYDTVIVDECQDINWTKRALVRAITGIGGRVIFVGDPHQAIMAFTGADHQSIANIMAEFNCTQLPLTFSYRCPKSVVRFAQQWVSHIQSAPDAPEGKVETIDEKAFLGMGLTVDDVVMCRNNAPLVDLFFSFLAKGIPVHIEGREIAGELIRVVNRFPKVKSLPVLVEKLEDYKARQIQKWNAKGIEDKAERIADVVDAILSVARALPATSEVSELREKITGMFQDANGEKKPTLTLTTIHKAKGREWNRVFWYARNLYNPSKYARKEWQIEAEKNLCYVGATRSKDELYDVYVEPKKKAA